uniref:hypothetical protein n=1 Tax=Flavobacterium sp. TaxID=239 RepID=UPI00404B303A
MKIKIIISILIITVISSYRTECQNAEIIAKKDFLNCDYEFHSVEMLPVDATFFFVLREYFDVKWRFIANYDSIGYFDCYNEKMSELLDKHYGFNVLEKSYSIADSLDKLPNWKKDAEFEGGFENFRKIIEEKLKNEIPASKKIGKIILFFRINENGIIDEFKLKDDIDTIITNKMGKIFKQIPKWSPSYKYGKPVKTMGSVKIELNK